MRHNEIFASREFFRKWKSALTGTAFYLAGKKPVQSKQSIVRATFPVDRHLFKVSKITLEQLSFKHNNRVYWYDYPYNKDTRSLLIQ